MGLKERLLTYIDFKEISTQAFEKAAGLSNAAVSKMGDNTRASTLDKISNSFPDLDIDWLRTGKGEMIKRDKIEVKQCKDYVNPPFVTYLIPISARGGSLTGIGADGIKLEDCEKIISPIANVDFAISIYGDSMAPEYPSGCQVLIKKIDPKVFIDWGKVYILDTSNGVILKEVLKCEGKEGYITCHSLNPDPRYADFDVSLSEVYGMYRVLMCLAGK